MPAIVKTIVATLFWLWSFGSVSYQLDFKVIQTLPSDPTIYTQGLYIEGNTLYQSGGHYGKSKIIKKNLITQNTIERPINAQFFAEGITMLQDSIYMLTWKAGVLLEFNKTYLQPTTNRAKYRGEGWGLTTLHQDFIRSDGSHLLWRHHSQTFEILDTIAVTFNGRKVDKLNELETIAIKGTDYIVANRYYNDTLFFIDQRGVVQYWLDLKPLRLQQPKTAEVTNGIAWWQAKNLLVVTGKYWHNLYVIKLNLKKN